MSAFSDLQERVSLNNLVAYLMYGPEAEIENSGTYEERIKQSYDKIFADLGELFPSASRQNDDLCNAVLDFSITHNEVYFEMGLLIGFQLYKMLDDKHHNIDLTSLQSIIKKNCSHNSEKENSNG